MVMSLEKRKVNLVGHNTLTVSLPTDFVRKNNIKKGDELNTIIDDSEVTFSLEQKRKESKEISLDISSFSSYMVARYITYLYINNYNKIVLTYSSSTVYNNKKKEEINIKHLIRKLVDRLLGAEITSQTSKSTEIECFLGDDIKSLEKIEKQIYFLLDETLKEMYDALEKDFESFHAGIYEHHDNLDKFINYYLRKLDVSEKSEEEKKVSYSFYNFLKYIIDKVRHLSEQINKYSSTEKIRSYFQEISSFLREEFNSLHKKRLNPELVSKRYNLVERLETEDFSLEEYKIISEMKVIMDSLNDFSDYILVKNFENN